jgi:hypothetical protein
VSVIEQERLRRELRALSAVNRQLQAQLDTGGGRVARSAAATAGGGAARGSIRRAGAASRWLDELELIGGVMDPFLVRGPDGAVFVVEGNYRRAVKSALLAAALVRALGGHRDATDKELEAWTEVVAVQVLEGPTGPPFVVVGGRRLPIRGLPLPYPVSADEMELFPEGQELNVSAAMSLAYQIGRARAIVARKGGPLPVAAAAGKYAARRVGRKARGLVKRR